MGTISVSLPSDGTIADVNDINAPITTIVNEINGNLDNDNIKASAGIAGSKLADASITNAKLATTAGELGGTWTAWTPVWTSNGSAPSIGNGTLTGSYAKIGKTVHFRIKFVGGSTTNWGTGSYFITLPLAPYSSVAANDGISLTGYGEDATVVSYYPIGGRMFDTTKFTALFVRGSDGNVFGWGQTAPFTWGTGDYWSGFGTYEAA